MSIRQHDFTIERRFRQTPAQAFRAFADPELKQRWFGVPDGLSLIHISEPTRQAAR